MDTHVRTHTHTHTYIIAFTYTYMYDKIQTYNAQVSTIVGSNPTASVSYWRYASGDEKAQYIQGQYLHQQAYPGSNFNSIG